MKMVLNLPNCRLRRLFAGCWVRPYIVKVEDIIAHENEIDRRQIGMLKLILK